MSPSKKIRVLLAIAAPLGVLAPACAKDATAPEEPGGLAVAAEATEEDGPDASLSPRENATTATQVTPEPTAEVSASALDASVACYHYYGESYLNSDCHSFWFDSNLEFLTKNCDNGPCNRFPTDWSNKSWGNWSGEGSKVICKGAWWPSEQQKKQLRVAFDNAPNC